MLDEVFGTVRHLPSNSQQVMKFPVSESDIMTAFGTRRLDECLVDLEFRNFKNLSVFEVNTFVKILSDVPVEILSLLKEIIEHFQSLSYLKLLLASKQYEILHDVINAETLGKSLFKSLGIKLSSEYRDYFDYERLGKEYMDRHTVFFGLDYAVRIICL